MFTGIVEELGTIVSLEQRDGTGNAHAPDGGAGSAVLVVQAPLVVADVAAGDSISVNGVCLTVTAFDARTFTVDVMAPTLLLTGVGGLRAGDRVNLERAMPADGRFGGHLVSGHIDGRAELLARTPGTDWERLEFAIPEALRRYVVPQGSIALDGVSLTVAEVTADGLAVGIIPTTAAHTTLGGRRPGESVNVEVDQVAKYVAGYLAGRGGDLTAAPAGASA